MIEFRHVTKRYGDGPAAVDDLSLVAPSHQITVLVGPSGCGKTTLLELIAGLAAQRGGTIAAAGETSAEERLRRCAYMPQKDLLLPWLSAADNAALAVRNRGVPRARK